MSRMMNAIAGVCLLIMVTMAGVMQAQTQTAQAAAPDQRSITVANALPGDNPPTNVERQLLVSMGPPAGTLAPPAKETVKPSLTYELALEAATTALQSCLADNSPVAVAVTDEAGNIRVSVSADGVTAGRTYVAVRKSLSAIMFKVPTSQLREMFKADPSLMQKVKPNMSLLPGALPLMVGDRVVGAIAVSGVMGYEEEKCASDGAKKIQARLK